jgi:hypothetical protein
VIEKYPMSDLEGQYEQEMEDYYESSEEPKGETDDILQKEFELDTERYEEPKGETDDILQREFELETERYEEPKGETEEFNFEMEDYEEPMGESNLSRDNLAQRLLELQERQFESEDSRKAAIEGVLTEIEKNFFIKKLAGGAIGGILKKLLGGLGAGNPLSFIKAAIALIRMAAKEPLRTTLLQVITSHPSLAPARPLLKLLGIAETAEYGANSLESWKEFVELSESMYEDIVNNLNEAALKDPVAANQIASKAFGTAASRIRARAPPGSYDRRNRRRYSLRLRPGQRIRLDIIGEEKR